MPFRLKTRFALTWVALALVGCTETTANDAPDSIAGSAGSNAATGGSASANAVAGTILGAKISQFDLKIANFESRPAVVELGGNADGPTPEFLKFVAQSPVAGYIDHFTDNARAAGNGKLALQLALPLGDAEARKLVPVRFNGQYTFVNNDVTLDDGLPKMDRVNGVLAFSERGVELRNLRGEALGGGFTLAGGTRPNGGIAVTGDGSFTVPGVAAWLKDPVFGSMTGGAPWRRAPNGVSYSQIRTITAWPRFAVPATV